MHIPVLPMFCLIQAWQEVEGNVGEMQDKYVWVGFPTVARRKRRAGLLKLSVAPWLPLEPLEVLLTSFSVIAVCMTMFHNFGLIGLWKETPGRGGYGVQD